MNIPDNLKFSTKHVQIDKSYAKMVAVIALAASVVIFCLVLSNSLIKQIQYQNKVISLRAKADSQLKKNVAAVKPLVASYETFDGASESVIGTQDKNAKIVLDALPSKYDFPATATSLEYIVEKSGMAVSGITGTDDEANAEQNSVNPKVVEIPFSLSVAGGYGSAKTLVSNLERSIRPFKINEISFSGTDATLSVDIKGVTYYQPERKLEITQTVVPGTNVKVTKKTTTTGAKQ